jgi:hypothetical protein
MRWRLVHNGRTIPGPSTHRPLSCHDVGSCIPVVPTVPFAAPSSP